MAQVARKHEKDDATSPTGAQSRRSLTAPAVPGDGIEAVIAIGARAADAESLQALLESADEFSTAILVVVTRNRETPVATRPESEPPADRRFVPIVDRLDAEAGRIYLAPADATVTLDGRRFRVRPAQEAPGKRGRIDSFLVSLAAQEKSRAIGVVLDGIGGDGTLGLTAIREEGGFALAERPAMDGAESGHASNHVPRNAVAVADIAVPASDIAGRILKHLGGLRQARPPASFDDLLTESAPVLPRIATVLRNRTGHDFHGYKRNTFLRRVQRRMQVTQAATAEDYLEVLRSVPDEAQHLFNDLLIGVTHFFRDSREFAALEREVVPRLFEGKGAGDQLRVWVLGCATGEEAYSIAILLREYMARLDTVPHLQVFATDIDNRALATARVGRYAAAALKDVTPERLARWFVKEGDTYCVVKELREVCIFSQHNLIKDAPFSRLDLVSCRNLLIYLDSELQNRVIPLFHFALRKDGFLFLGNSENVTRHGKLFTVMDRRYRIFRRREGPARGLPAFPLAAVPDRRPGTAQRSTPAPASHSGEAIAKQVERVVERYAPAYLVLDENFDVLHFSGRTGKFLEPSTGVASLNVFNLIHRDLRMDLRTALQKAIAEKQAVRCSGLKIGQDGEPLLVTLSVERIDAGARHPHRLAVILQDGYVVTHLDDDAGVAAAVRAGTGHDEHVRQIEEELQLTHDRLQATIEELESTNEELKASNEEYQSVNEELQSSNEEMETAKEELQSLNEELQTVNGELAHRVEELARANSDIKNLFESTQIATVFLDNELRLKNFTPAATELFHLIEGDLGRPIHHVTRMVAYEDLEQDVRRVIRTLGKVEREVGNPGTGSQYLARVLPYRSVDNVIEGAIVTFLDVTRLVSAEALLRESENRYWMLFDSIGEGFAIIERVDRERGQAATFRFLTANAAFARHTGVGDVIGRTLRDAFPGEPEEWIARFETVLRTGESVRFEYALAGRDRILDLYAFRVDDSSQRLAVIFHDVTVRRRTDAALRDSEARLRAILEGIPQLVWRSGAGGHWTWCSPQWMAFTGQSEAEALERGWLAAVHPEDRDRVSAAWSEADRSGLLEIDHRLWNAGARDYRSVHLRATPVRDEAGRLVEWFGTATDVNDMLLLQERQQVLLHELQHRVRNILAVVRSIARRSATTSDSVEDYARHLEGRINAMARAQNVLTSAPGARVKLHTLIVDELQAQGADMDRQVEVSGPAVTLSGKAAEMLSLAIHELATNAAKYGALAVEGGGGSGSTGPTASMATPRP